MRLTSLLFVCLLAATSSCAGPKFVKAATIIPGHGPVMHDTTYLQTLIEMFQALTAQVNQAVADKLTLAEIHKKVTLPDFEKRLASDDRMRIRDFRGGFLYPAIDRAYQEATGTLKPESMDE